MPLLELGHLEESRKGMSLVSDSGMLLHPVVLSAGSCLVMFHPAGTSLAFCSGVLFHPAGMLLASCSEELFHAAGMLLHPSVMLLACSSGMRFHAE